MRAKVRRLGQHFLRDGNVSRRIVALGELDGRPPVVEIGPGRGALTGLLRERTDRLHLIEIDPALAGELRARYVGDAGVTITEGDVLGIDAAHILDDAAAHVVGNLPYRVASQILLRLIDWRARCPLAVVMLQEEVARRVVAQPGTRNYGVLTLLIQLYAETEYCFTVSRRCFSPPPKVESAVVRLRLHGEPRVPVVDPALFRIVVRSVFQQRRKMVRNTIGTALSLIGAAVDGEEILRAAGIDPSARPERLGLSEFATLTGVIAAHQDGVGD